jgi:hypothetical protein
MKDAMRSFVAIHVARPRRIYCSLKDLWAAQP